MCQHSPRHLVCIQLCHVRRASVIVPQAVEVVVKFPKVLTFTMCSRTSKAGRHGHSHRHAAARRSAQTGIQPACPDRDPLSSRPVECEMTTAINSRTDHLISTDSAVQNLSTNVPSAAKLYNSSNLYPKMWDRNGRDRRMQEPRGSLASVDASVVRPRRDNAGTS